MGLSRSSRKSSEAGIALNLRLPPTKVRLVEAIQILRDHRNRHQALQEAVDQYIAKYRDEAESVVKFVDARRAEIAESDPKTRKAG